MPDEGYFCLIGCLIGLEIIKIVYDGSKENTFMGMTIAEKIIALRAGLDSVEPGQRVTVEVDRFLLSEPDLFGVLSLARSMGRTELTKESARVVAALDPYIGMSADGSGARAEAMCRIRLDWRSWGIGKLYDFENGGFGSLIFCDGGHVVPGSVVAVCRERYRSFGAVGALPVVLDVHSILEAMDSGKAAIDVPETVRVVVNGSLPHWSGGKDIALHAIGVLRQEMVRGRAVEFSGDAIKGLDLHQRLALTAFASNLCAQHVIVEPDHKTDVFIRARTDRYSQGIRCDEDAQYHEIIEIDASSIEPQVMIPPKDGVRVLKVSKTRDLKVHQVVIGTGGNGRIEDLRTAAALLREYQVSNRVKLVLVPGSQHVYMHAMEEGLIQIFLRSGAHVTPPSEHYSNQCHLMGIIEGERCLSTSGRIFREDGKAGSREILYCNPAVAAASAVLGYTVEPFSMIRAVKRMSTGLMS